MRNCLIVLAFAVVGGFFIGTLVFLGIYAFKDTTIYHAISEEIEQTKNNFRLSQQEGEGTSGNETVNASDENTMSDSVAHRDSVYLRPVDLGLSVYWADRNLGAEQEAQGLTGQYYARDGEPYVSMGQPVEETAKQLETLKGSSYDPAFRQLGGAWRLPTKAEVEELCAKCRCLWTMENGVKGFRFERKEQMIFLPVAGFRYERKFTEQREEGYYWIADNQQENTCYFSRRDGVVFRKLLPDYGLSVRPVMGKQKRSKNF